MRVINTVSLTENIEVITFAREDLLRHSKGIGNLTVIVCLAYAWVEFLKLVVHKAGIEGRVVRDQFRVFNELEELFMNILVFRFINQKLIGNTVNTNRLFLNRTIGLDVDVEVTPSQFTVNDLYRTDLDNAVP